MKFKRVLLPLFLITTLLNMTSCSPFVVDFNIVNEIDIDTAMRYASDANIFYYAGRSRSINIIDSYDFTDMNAPIYNNFKINRDYLLSETAYENKDITPVVAKEEIIENQITSDNKKIIKIIENEIYRWKYNNTFFIQETSYLNNVRYPTNIYKIKEPILNEFFETNFYLGLKFPIEIFSNYTQIETGFNASNELILKGSYEEENNITIDYINQSLDVVSVYEFKYRLSFKSSHEGQNRYDAFNYCEINKKMYAKTDFNSKIFEEYKLINKRNVYVACEYGVIGDYDLTKFPSLTPFMYKEVSCEEFI